MSPESDLGPNGKKVCKFCVLRDDPEYYVDKPLCGNAGITYCNQNYGSVEYWRSQERIRDPDDQPHKPNIGKKQR